MKERQIRPAQTAIGREIKPKNPCKKPFDEPSDIKATLWRCNEESIE
jgi:hypothetical protein